jgi:hypothetical protein
MTVKLISLLATGPDKVDAVVDFRSPATLVRGPSDTGKSYIRDCLWYLMGGEKPTKKIPEAAGYDLLSLTVECIDETYVLQRAHAGGETGVTRVVATVDGSITGERVDEDVNSLLVRSAGAQGKQLLRSKSKRGGVTGGDLRHWFLLSQPSMISEDPTAGIGNNSTQRIAAFHMFLTGTDDSAIELSKTSKELDRISGQILGAEQSLLRVRADIPDDVNREDVAAALERVDLALGAMASHYEERSSLLKTLRNDVLTTADRLRKVEDERSHTIGMIQRFQLLDEKYKSDSERLGATWEGVAMFQALEEVPCPLCGTPSEVQLEYRELRQAPPDAYRRALKAELEKIRLLRNGLTDALTREESRELALADAARTYRQQLSELEAVERRRVAETRYEFSGDPKALALRRSELSEQLARFGEEARLISEIERLKQSKKRQKSTLSRNVGDADMKVADYAKSYLADWGFGSLQSVVLDAEACDLIIDGRARLDFGAGKRSIFLAALTIAVMEHAVSSGHPHLGVVVIDSPLKSYADPKSKEKREVPLATVTDHFYAWLAKWSGPGQIVILENQEIKEDSKALLDPVEFVGDGGDEGRRGFYPVP